MKKSYFVVLSALSLVCLCTLNILPLQPRQILAGAYPENAYEGAVSDRAQEIGSWYELVDWLRNFYQENQENPELLRIALNAMITKDIGHLFGEDPNILIAEIYEEITGKPYPVELEAVAIQKIEHQAGKPLSQIVSQYLASLSSEELKNIDRAIKPYLEGTGKILDELENYSRIESSGQKVDELSQSQPEDAPLFKAIQELEREMGRPLSQVIGEHLSSISPDNLNKINALIRHYAQSGLLGSSPENTGKKLTKGLSASALHRAIQNEDIVAIKKLLSEKANVNVRSTMHGNTPLHEAVSVENPDIVALLIQAGANPNAQDTDDGNTPLHDAVNDNNLVIIKLLVQAGANIDARDNSGRTPLYDAVSNGSNNTSKTLVELGANVNAQNNDGEAPLHRAVIERNVNLVEMLIEAGADTALKDNEGKTALDYAHEAGHPDIVNIFVNLPQRSLDYITKHLREHKAQQAHAKKAHPEVTPIPVKPQWALDATGNVVYTGSDGKQQTIPAQFGMIVASADGMQVWALNDQYQIFRRFGITNESPIGTTWTLIPGLLKEIVITPNNVIWGVNAGGYVFFTNKNTDANPAGIGWPFIPGELLSTISVDNSGEVTGKTLDGRTIKRAGVTLDNPIGTSWEVIS